MISVTATVNSDETNGTWTEAFMPPSNPKLCNVGRFSVSVSGTFSATVTLQRSFDNGSTWLDVTTYTSENEDTRLDATFGILYRIGCKNGEYTSGTVNLILAK